MALNIRHAETERLASELAEMTGQTQDHGRPRGAPRPCGATAKGTVRADPGCRVECHRRALRASAAPGQAFAG